MPDYGALLEDIRRLHWRSGRPVRGALPGAHPSARRGTSAEFAEYRSYRQGDALPRVDWKLFARTDRPYLRLSTDRTVLPTMVVVDASASMAYPVGTAAKLERARQLAVALAAVAHHQGDPIGVAVAAESVHIFVPRTRGTVVHEIVGVVSSPSARAGVDIVGAFAGAARLARRVAVISDFLADEDDLLGSARAHIARGGEVHAVHVVAAEELDPATGVVRDPEETGDRRVLAGAVLSEYQSSFASWREALANSWRAVGASYTLSRTDEDAAADVRRIVAAGGARAAR